MLKMNFAALARKAKMSPKAFAQANIHSDSEVGKLARMYYIASGVHGSGNTNADSAGDVRSIGARMYQIG